MKTCRGWRALAAVAMLACIAVVAAADESPDAAATAAAAAAAGSGTQTGASVAAAGKAVGSAGFGFGCAAGMGVRQDVDGCWPCPKGSWNDGKDNSCQVCSDGLTTLGEGADSYTDCVCPPGSTKTVSLRLGGSVCSPTCARNTFLDADGGKCVACPVGFTSKAGSVGKPACRKAVPTGCPRGRGLASLMSTRCMPCKLGYWNPGGLVMCARCPNGLTTIKQGSTECGCPAGKGTTTNPPSETCTPCPAGTFSTGGTMAPCARCPGPFMTSPPGSTSAKFCMCKAGYGATADFPGVCQVCPRGSFSMGAAALAGSLSVGKRAAPDGPSLAPCTSCCAPGEAICDMTTKRPGSTKPDHCIAKVTPPSSPPPPPPTPLPENPDFLPSVILKPNPKATKEIKIGCILPLGNGSSPEDFSVAEAVLVGIEMAINDTLKTQLTRHWVNLTCYNSQCSGLPAAAGVQFLAAEGVIGILGDICSTSCLAAAAAAKPLQVPIISPAATSPSLSMKDYFYRTVPSDIFQAFAASNLMFEDFGAKHVGIVFEANTYGYGLADNLSPDDGEYSVTETYEFPPGEGNPAKAVELMLAAKTDPSKEIDAIFLAMNDAQFAANFMIEAKKQGLDLPLYGGDTLTTPALLDMVRGQPSDIDKLTSISINPGHASFIEKYTNAANGLKFEPYAAPAYDATVALLKAYQDAVKPATPVTIEQALRDEVFEGVSGPIQFDIFGDLVPHAESYVYGMFNLATDKFELIGFTSK